jgi:hypothetical protein
MENESLRGAPVEPVPAPEITRLIHVIEEARAIAWDLYENPWDIPDAARDEISDLHRFDFGAGGVQFVLHVVPLELRYGDGRQPSEDHEIEPAKWIGLARRWRCFTCDGLVEHVLGKWIHVEGHDFSREYVEAKFYEAATKSTNYEGEISELRAEIESLRGAPVVAGELTPKLRAILEKHAGIEGACWECAKGAEVDGDGVQIGIDDERAISVEAPCDAYIAAALALGVLESAPVPAPRLSKGELVEIWCKAQYEGRMRELIALYGPESPYVEMYEGGWETCDRASKESNRRSATYIIDALENINAVLSPPVGTQPKEN